MPSESGQTLRARVLYSGEVIAIAQSSESPLSPGDIAVVDTRFGEDLARVLGACPAADEEVFAARSPMPGEESEGAASRELERDARHFAMACIDDLRLDMHLVSVHQVLGGERLLFFFTAEARVDFRGLVKLLAERFRTRIELRQISSREETRMTGGLGICGRELCCASLGCRLESVSIRMAKAQGLSLSSSKLSGQCGRLLCCLAYENDFYRDAAASFPPPGTQVDLAGTSWEVVSRDFIRSSITVRDSAGEHRSLDAALVERTGAREWVARVATLEVSE